MELDMNRWQVLIDLIKTNNYRKIAEIGVYHGKTARHILEACELDEYYCIDPVQYYPFAEWLIERRKQIKTDIQYWIVRSDMAVKVIDNQSLDLVFIDALHDYDNVKADIESWKPKVRNGGILCGDDYGQIHCEGVKEAVDEVFGNNIELIPVGRKECKIWVVRF